MTMRHAAELSVLISLAIAASALAQDAEQAQDDSSRVRCLAFSPDGQSLAVAYADNSLVIWNVWTRQEFVREKTPVLSLAYSPQGDVLAIAVGKVVRLLDPATGNARSELDGHKMNIRSLAFTPDGKQLATAGEDASVKLWDLASGQARAKWKTTFDEVMSIAISANGKWMATSCHPPTPEHGDNDIELRRLDVPDQPARKIAARGYIPQVVFSPDGQLVIPSWSSSLVMIDVATGDERLRFTGTGGTNRVAISPDGRMMVVCGLSPILNILPFQQPPSADHERRIAALIERFQDDDYATREAASKELAEIGGEALAQLRAGLESDSAEVRVRCRRLVQRIQSEEFAPKLTGHEANITCIAFSPKGDLLASGDAKGVIKLWNMAENKELATLKRQ
jgi:WD40 repeat protein